MPKEPDFTEKAYCDKCGADISGNIQINFTNKGTKIAYFIKPCKKCLEEMRCAGENSSELYDDGYRDGYCEGYDDGYNDAYDEGYDEGYADAEQEYNN